MSVEVVATSTAHYLDQLEHSLADHGSWTLIVQLGHRVVEVRSCCSSLRDVLWSHLSHLSSTDPPDSVIFLVDCDHSAEVSPRIDWTWRGWNYADATGFAQYLAHSHTLLVRTNDGSSVAYVSKRESPSHWNLREHLRQSFQWILGFMGIDSLHGATLGRGDRGVFLTGRGGSGKSTLVAAGVRAGFTTVGEDFLLLGDSSATAHPPRLHSFFRTGKLEPSSPAHAYFSSKGETSDGKHLVDLTEFAPHCVVSSQEVIAAISLSVTGSTQLTPSTVHQFRAALLPHSAPLNLFPQRMAQTVAQMLEPLPQFHLTSGPAIDDTLAAIDELISS